MTVRSCGIEEGNRFTSFKWNPSVVRDMGLIRGFLKLVKWSFIAIGLFAVLFVFGYYGWYGECPELADPTATDQ